MMATLAAIGLTMPQVPLISPEVNSDRTVTFRFRDRSAKKVEIGIEGSDSVPMIRDKDGIWSLTTKPLEPDIYGYTFSADGETRIDPLNPFFKPNLIWQGNAVLVPGTPPREWEVRNVPHGSVHRHFYHSEIAGDDRDYFVYTPPGYGSGKGKKYPVLYLLHGYSDLASGWTAVGQAHTIMDNLIAAGKVTPMVVVMPLGYGVTNFASPLKWGFGDTELTKKNFTNYHQILMKEVMPQVEQQYAISAKQSMRAIAGLSMGGAESLYVGLHEPDSFAYIGAFSSGGLPSIDFVNDGVDYKRAAEKVKFVWMACGTEDGLLGFSQGFHSELERRKIRVTYTETPGRHVWMLWRRNLISFAQLIFK